MDEQGALVVPLREYLEDKIQAGHAELKAEIQHVRADLAQVQANGTKEHAEVRADLKALHSTVAALKASSVTVADLDELKRSVEALKDANLTQRGGFTALGKAATALGALVTVAGALTAIAFAIADHF